MGRLSRLAVEELVAVILLVVLLTVVALHPAALTERFQVFATPAPGGGPAREIVPDAPTPSPETVLPFGIGLP